MRRFVLVNVVLILSVVLAGCGTSGTDTTTSSVSTATTQPPATTTTSATTTTTTIPTTTTAPPTPAELRAEMIGLLEDEGWIKHEDETGWSIWYPPDWTVAFAGDGDLGLVSPGDGSSASVFLVSIALNSAPDSEGSLDYLIHDANLAQDEGLMESFDQDGAYHVDLNWNGVEDLRDIYVLEMTLAKDPVSGEPIPEDAIAAPIWWYGYYDPEARPDYGYIFQIWGTDVMAFDTVDRLVYSFEPPGGVLGLDGTSDSTSSTLNGRQELISEWMASDWVEHEDPLGWSMWIPEEWSVETDGTGNTIFSAGDVAVVGVLAFDDTHGMEGSEDYLLESLTEAGVSGFITGFDFSEDLWLDLDQDGTEGPYDMWGVPVDMWDGSSGWAYAYFDPTTPSDLGYFFNVIDLQSAGDALQEIAEAVLLTFEPEGGQ